MPVSLTLNATTRSARSSLGLGDQLDRPDRDGDVADVGELERVGQQVLDDLLQPLDVGGHRLGQRGVERHAEVDLLDSARWRKVRST